MKKVKMNFTVLLKAVLFIILLTTTLSGCSNVDSNQIVSYNNLDFNGDSRIEKLLIYMADGKYQVTDDSGSQTAWNWEGQFSLQLFDSRDNLISTLNINKALNISKMNFNGKFTLEFDDYNGDGNYDFSLGQFSSNNMFYYYLFTIKSNGIIELLPVEVGSIPSYYEGYSRKFEKYGNKGFKTVYFNSFSGNNVEVTYEWQDNKFVLLRTVEFELGKDAPDNVEEVVEDGNQNTKETEDGDKNVSDGDKTEDNIVDVITIPNMNSDENQEISLPLIEGMKAVRSAWEMSQGFKFKQQKNKELKEIYQYQIIDSEGNEIGWFGLIERQQGEYEFALPENLQFEDLRYKGPTKLGQGKVFLLWLDLPEDEIKDNTEEGLEEEIEENIEYIQEYFAYIPVENEDLAYNFRLKVTDSEKLGEIFDYMRKIIITDEDVEQKIHEMFENAEPEKIEEILSLLPYLDWVKLAGISNYSFNNLVQWLSNYKFDNPDQLAVLLISTNGLDGVYAEAFSFMLKDVFIKNEPEFIKALLNIDEDQRELISFYIVYALEANRDEATINYFKEGLQSGRYRQEERQVIEFILDALGIGM
ncbi:MAG TPA: hypothetical protein GXX20_07495 [Clostridiaceae bacterium]|nr:hypothetical protein [Clostridiaceae bacterium]